MALAEPTVPPLPRGWGDRLYATWTRLLSSRRVQARAARLPLASAIARRDGERLFDLTAGFLHSQILQAFVVFDIPARLSDAPATAGDLATGCGVPADRMEVFCQGAAALGLLKRRRDGRYGLGRLGAALPGVPGLADMIRHHDVLYRDMADPVAFFRDGSDTELARFWPYVFGAAGDIDPEVAARYSRLMAESQTLIAEEVLAHLDLRGVDRLLDVGGGSGVFLAAVAAAYPDLQLHLFDLPEVAPAARARFGAAGLAARTTISSGSFRVDPLPMGADAISLVRVLYDHTDDTVRALLAKAHAALPDDGRIIIAEPMAGGQTPSRAGDAYFGLYCMAMGTGRARSADRIAALLQNAGFSRVRRRKTGRPFVTGLVEARKMSS